MGENADQLIDDGEAMLLAHQRGECDFDCQYCAEEDVENSEELIKDIRVAFHTSEFCNPTSFDEDIWELNRRRRL